MESLLKESKDLQYIFLKTISKEDCDIVSISGGGLNEKDVPCIFGGVTKSKIDMKVVLSVESVVNVLIKKVYLGKFI